MEAPREGETGTAEIHRRYAWMQFADGVSRDVLLTIKRWDETRDANSDTAYALEAIEVKENATDGKPPGTAIAGDQAVTGDAGANLSRFLSGIKPEHLYDTGSSSFSLGNAQLADLLAGDAISRIKNPLQRAQAMARTAQKLENARLNAERLDLISASKRIGKSLKKEAAMREAMRLDELENQAYARHFGVLSNDDLVRIKAQPAHQALADPKSHLRGRLVSKSAAMQRQPDLFVRQKSGDYDGADGISRSVFGGTLMPDQAAQELFDSGIIKSPTVDALWNKLREEQNMVAGMKELLAKAQDDIRSAKATAKKETNEWLAKATESAKSTAALSTKQEIIQNLGMLDGILAALPADLRRAVGGYTQLARLGTNEARLAYLREKLATVDKHLEDYLREQYGKEFDALLKRAKPKKGEAGEKPKGHVGADVHDLFRELADAMNLNGTEAEAEAVKLETLAADPDITADRQSHLILQANLTRLVGDWKNADASRRESAVIEATKVFDRGYYEHKFQTLAKRQTRANWRQKLQDVLPVKGDRMERKAKGKQDEGTKLGRAVQSVLSLASFEQHCIAGGWRILGS